MKAIQALAASSTLLVASFIAHILAGGSSISLHSAGAILLVITAITWFLSRVAGDPIRVALAILTAQNLGHFILGGHARSDSQMVLSHLVAGVLSYHLIRYFDKTLPTIGDFFHAIVPPVFLNLAHLFLAPKAHPEFSYRALTSLFRSITYSLRAPPLY